MKKMLEKINPQNSISNFKGTCLYPQNRNAVDHHILIIEKNDKEHIPEGSTNKESTQEAEFFLNSTLKGLKKAIQVILC